MLENQHEKILKKMQKVLDGLHIVVVKCLHNHKLKSTKGKHMKIIKIETTVYVKLDDGREKTVYLPSFDYDFEESYKEAIPSKAEAKSDALQAIMELARENPDLFSNNIESAEVVYECECGCKSFAVKF